MLKVYGVQLSPFVRKLLLTLEYKGLEYENVATFPGSEEPEFRAISPLGKIPVLDHDGLTISDTSVICRYVDRVFADKSIYPDDPVEEAKALWLEEFGDSKLIEATSGLFQQRFLYPKMFGQETDESVVTDILENKLPPLLDYLESVVPEAGYLVGDSVTIADFSIGTCFLQGRYGEYEVDAGQYPKLAAYLARVLSADLVQNRMAKEAEVVAQLAG